ncbi:Golgi-associated plant pathogenesis-related protein 1-like isoform X1 [Parasteatoda tepidariorum]|uniref:Golgi-associated plant pathogenesis-related protein 1-like isoform X1 n=1 Tax=Parasteatoda tepidariorum TaxID=114398 RepID=UPI0039BD891C
MSGNLNCCYSYLQITGMDEVDDSDNDSCFLPPSKNLSFDVEDFRQRTIAAHNTYRRIHDSPDLTHLQELEDGAQIWAETIAAKGYFQYCEHLYNIGESLCTVNLIGARPTPEDIVRNWYKEIKHYSFAEPRWRRGAFHFTQMIWRSSLHIGIGIAPVPGKPMLHVVVRYFPGGNSNFPGEFQKNVLPRISAPSTGSLSQSMEDCSFVRTYSTKLRQSGVYI